MSRHRRTSLTATGFTVDAARAASRRRLEKLPVNEFPILAGCARELAELDADAAYELGLEALLIGLRDDITPRPR